MFLDSSATVFERVFVEAKRTLAGRRGARLILWGGVPHKKWSIENLGPEDKTRHANQIEERHG